MWFYVPILFGTDWCRNLWRQFLFSISAFLAGICYDSAFGCSRGNCVPSSARCDGSKDCADGDDEIACGE